MNPRLVEPGFVVVRLHADGPARPRKDENGEDEAQREGRHQNEQPTGDRLGAPAAAQCFLTGRSRLPVATAATMKSCALG